MEEVSVTGGIPWMCIILSSFQPHPLLPAQHRVKHSDNSHCHDGLVDCELEAFGPDRSLLPSVALAGYSVSVIHD